MGDSHNGWFIMENPILKLMIWGYPHFRKPPYLCPKNGFAASDCGFLCPIVKIQQGKLQLPEFNAAPA